MTVATLRTLLEKATQRPWYWAGHSDGAIELRGVPGGQRVITTVAADLCMQEDESGDLRLSRTACATCRRNYKKFLRGDDLDGIKRCEKRENLHTLWLRNHERDVIEPSNKWAVQEVDYRTDVASIDHPDAQLIVKSVNTLPALLEVAELADELVRAIDEDRQHANKVVRLQAALARLEEAK